MRILIVDDSIVFRSQIKASLEGAADITVVGAASNGKIALDLLSQHDCDLVILDLEMPVMNGLETLAEMRRLKLPQRVIVFAAPTSDGARQVFEAFNLGAVDFIAKPDSARSLEEALEGIQKQLVPKILQFAKRLSARLPDPMPGKALPEAAPADTDFKPSSSYTRVTLEVFRPRIVVIASSTGGPLALETIFTALKGKTANIPILIAQHMPPHFTECLAKRLETLSGIPAAEGRAGELLKPGRIYIAPGDFHMSVQRLPDGGACIIKIDQGPKRNSVRPAADNLFESVAAAYGSTAAAFVLTGMGEDGCLGAKAIKQGTGGVMIQSKESSVVWGMPGAVAAVGAFDAVGDLAECARVLIHMVT